jgi:hypothetical protein
VFERTFSTWTFSDPELLELAGLAESVPDLLIDPVI